MNISIMRPVISGQVFLPIFENLISSFKEFILKAAKIVLA
jgi:hypothetical protein